MIGARRDGSTGVGGVIEARLEGKSVENRKARSFFGTDPSGSFATTEDLGSIGLTKGGPLWSYRRSERFQGCVA